MATLAVMKARIADELARDDLTSQIALAITSAIAHYERRRWWFNEQTSTFTTVAGTDTYTTSSATFLASLIDDDVLTITVDGATDPLGKITFAEMARLRIDTTTQSGPPAKYALYMQRLYLWPVPDDTYTMTVFYAGNLTALANDSATNAWTTEAEELIRLHAKVDLLENVIRDFPEADRMRMREMDVLASLSGLNHSRTATGRVVPEYL